MHVFDTHLKVLARILVYDQVAGRGSFILARQNDSAQGMRSASSGRLWHVKSRPIWQS